ncbi:YIP1 family protein [Chryseobacterium gwangjuense]|uniref:YIP1 family protein n=1 Tax=Chryseobacterium gwangjuense TaxID=1069980 RepID=UPI001E56199C|nr:YIP1 family protein [Chryseobacterium gwangjuense]MCE3075865.1 YIP1 family protein [Chryseobacterium gwangjuense]
MNWKTIFNPFSKYSEKQLLLVGILSLGITLVICQWFGLQVDSIFHYRYADEKHSLIENIGLSLLSYSIAIIIFFILGKIYNKRARFIDIVNTILISQIPGIFILLIGELPIVNNSMESVRLMAEKNPENISPFDLIIICIFSFSALLLIAYGITLFYNGFKTATNVKNWKQIVIFAFLIMVTTITCQFIF